MFGLGKKKVEQAQFVGELERLLSSYQEWGGGENPDVVPTLASRLIEFKRITPDRKDSDRLHCALCDLIENQVKAMSYVGVAMLASDQGDFRRGAKEIRTGQIYMARMHRSADVLVGLVESMGESDPMRKLLIDNGVYDPSGGAQPSSVELPSAAERSHALDFLRAVQWCTSRQQLAMEEWNDAVAIEVTGPLGDEMYNVPSFELNAATAPRLLPDAERRLASAQLVRDELARRKSGEVPDPVASAMDAWTRAFDLHLRRCEMTVRNLRALIAGTPAGPDNEAALVRDESALLDQAVAAEANVMERCGISSAELQEMMVTACNNLRFELGKPPLSFEEYGALNKWGQPGQRPRFFT